MAKVPDTQEMLGGSAVWLNLGWKGKPWNLLLTWCICEDWGGKIWLPQENPQLVGAFLNRWMVGCWL